MYLASSRVFDKTGLQGRLECILQGGLVKGPRPDRERP